ncbi:MAG TPA: tyrosine-type recombinase/integrase [Methylotenera sp.]|nr:tyrosine-type recombinase/integrase [Methylotenera sp.]
MSIHKLTQEFIDHKLQCPDGKLREEIVSDDRSGLYVEVRSASKGRGSFYLRYRDVNGKTCHQKIGLTTEMSLQEAKLAVKKLKAEIDLGADPRAEEKARLAVITFDEFFKEHYLPFVIPRKRSWKRDEELYRLRISAKFGSNRLNQVTRQQIQSFLSSLITEGFLKPASINHHLKLIRRMLNLAIEWEMLEKNVASGIKMLFEDNMTTEYMDDEELARLLKVLKTDSRRSVCNIALFLLATGARLNEALSAKWDQIDLDKRIWLIPASNTKSRRSRPCPISQHALDVLNQLDTQGNYEHLFINKRTKLPYVNIAKVWGRLRVKAGLPKLKLHSLRHQFASLHVSSGASLFIVQQLLGHANPITSMRYSHLSIKALQEASLGASAIITGAMPAESEGVSRAA